MRNPLNMMETHKAKYSSGFSQTSLLLFRKACVILRGKTGVGCECVCMCVCVVCMSFILCVYVCLCVCHLWFCRMLHQGPLVVKDQTEVRCGRLDDVTCSTTRERHHNTTHSTTTPPLHHHQTRTPHITPPHHKTQNHHTPEAWITKHRIYFC